MEASNAHGWGLSQAARYGIITHEYIHHKGEVNQLLRIRYRFMRELSSHVCMYVALDVGTCAFLVKRGEYGIRQKRVIDHLSLWSSSISGSKRRFEAYSKI